MNDKTFNMISNGIFTSLLIYCLPVFGNVWLNNTGDTQRFKVFTKEDSRRLQVLQNQTMRLKTHANKYTSCKDLVAKSGELSINQLVAYHTLLQVHKTILSQQPEYIFKNFNIRVQGENQIFPHRQAYTVVANRNLSVSCSA